jgi:protein involved in polysaccharide export with SLBB domain
MIKTRRSCVRFVCLLLTFAGLMQLTLLATYAQSNSANQNTYFIQGAVNKPGVYRIESTPSLITVLALAGGLADRHGAVAFIIRRQSAKETADQEAAFEVVQVRIDELLKGNFAGAAHLEPGDMVNIPPVDVFFVAGEVKYAGSFSFTEGVTLLQAIARSGGLTSGAKPSRALIFRQDPNSGKRQEITVDLDAVTSGKQKDIPLLPNDIIILPSSGGGTPKLRFLDTPPARGLAPCRDSRPCAARSDLTLFESACCGD